MAAGSFWRQRPIEGKGGKRERKGEKRCRLPPIIPGKRANRLVSVLPNVPREKKEGKGEKKRTTTLCKSRYQAERTNPFPWPITKRKKKGGGEGGKKKRGPLELRSHPPPEPDRKGKEKIAEERSGGPIQENSCTSLNSQERERGGGRKRRGKGEEENIHQPIGKLFAPILYNRSWGKKKKKREKPPMGIGCERITLQKREKKKGKKERRAGIRSAPPLLTGSITQFDSSDWGKKKGEGEGKTRMATR